MIDPADEGAIYIGTMSGTSMDGLDLVAVSFETGKTPILIANQQHDYPGRLRTALHTLAVEEDATVTRMCELDSALGEFYADQINHFIESSNLDKASIGAIGSHGQTIRHRTGINHPYSLQIGDPNIIAARTKLTVIADFRRRDIALGGEGAPFAPAFHQQVFHSAHENRVILNIGGIANITCLPANREQPVIGFDTGPGNTLLDCLCRHAFNMPYDDQGNLARGGRILPDHLRSLLKDEPYFTQSPPKSTGTDYFSPAWLANTGLLKEQPADALATLVELVSMTIVRAINNLPLSIDKVFVCGGGIHNLYLVNRLKDHLKGIDLESTAALGINPNLVEAMAFAWLAQQTLLGKPGNLPSVTNAQNFTILGGVYY